MVREPMTLRELNRATLARQLLLARETLPAMEVLHRLAGMQAQEPRPPYLGLWTRLTDFQPDELLDALHARAAVRGTVLRGTLFLVTADDFLTMRPFGHDTNLRGLKVLGDRAAGLDVDATLAAARELLEAEPRTFGELRGLLQTRFPDVNDRALGFTVRMMIPLVMVPTDDRWGFPRDARFALAASWLGRPVPEVGDVAGLVLRYLAAFGPATVRDFGTWSGLQQLKPVFEELREQLVVFAGPDGRELFDLPDAPRPAADTPAPVRFLPEFDHLLLAHADRTRVISDEHRPRVATKNLRILATFLVDGVVAGTWKVERKRAKATLRLTPFGALTKRVTAELEREGDALLRFTEPDAREYAVARDLGG